MVEKTQKQILAESLKKYKESNTNQVVGDSIPKFNFNKDEFEKSMSRETDPDLMIVYESIKLPSKGLFYSNGLDEVNVEYMTSKDEDLLTTPSLVESNTVLDILLKRKIKSQGVVVEDLLPGDRNAIILFLRTSSYGSNYNIQATDPRTNIPFKTSVDLLKLEYKNNNILPDQYGFFTVEIPMRKKTVTFKLLTSGDEAKLQKKANEIKEAYGLEFSDFNTMKLKASIIAINEKIDRSYIDKFVDSMPALDGLVIRKKILDVSPDVNMEYEFTAQDGYKFKSYLSVGMDFFFPSLD
jgi:hypothetical protein